VANRSWTPRDVAWPPRRFTNQGHPPAWPTEPGVAIRRLACSPVNEPVAWSPRSCWKRRIAARVSGPKTPSTGPGSYPSRCSAACTLRRSGADISASTGTGAAGAAAVAVGGAAGGDTEGAADGAAAVGAGGAGGVAGSAIPDVDGTAVVVARGGVGCSDDIDADIAAGASGVGTGGADDDAGGAGDGVAVVDGGAIVDGGTVGSIGALVPAGVDRSETTFCCPSPKGESSRPATVSRPTDRAKNARVTQLVLILTAQSLCRSDETVWLYLKTRQCLSVVTKSLSDAAPRLRSLTIAIGRHGIYCDRGR